MLSLVAYLRREMGRSSVRIVVALLVVGLSRGVLLTIFNAGAAQAMAKSFSWYLPSAFAVVLILYLLASYDSIHNSVNAVESMRERIRVRLTRKLMLTELRFLETNGAGEIYTQLSTDLERLRDAAMTFLNMASATVLVIFSFAYLAWLSPAMFFATLLTACTGAAFYFWIDRDLNSWIHQARHREVALFDALDSTLRGFKELKLSRARQRDHSRRVAEIAREFRVLWTKSETLYQLTRISSQTFVFLLIAIIAFVGSFFLHTTGTRIFQVVATVLFIAGPLENLLQAVPALAKARVSLESIEQLEAELDVDVAALPTQTDVLFPSFDTIAFRGMHFRFEGKTAEESFDVGPLDLDIRRNEILFVVGGNGTGKTTLLKLLTGLYSSAQGTILIDGAEIGEDERQPFRELFGAVFGDFHLFAQLYGLGALNPAAAMALFGELGIGRKTHIRDGILSTISLSTGQRKRLAYAISRLLDRQIYVFDEFAADQDPIFRAHFYTTLLPGLKRDGKTVIAVTHDDRWFNFADRVVKMEDGRVIEISQQSCSAQGYEVFQTGN